MTRPKLPKWPLPGSLRQINGQRPQGWSDSGVKRMDDFTPGCPPLPATLSAAASVWADFRWPSKAVRSPVAWTPLVKREPCSHPRSLSGRKAIRGQEMGSQRGRASVPSIPSLLTRRKMPRLEGLRSLSAEDAKCWESGQTSAIGLSMVTILMVVLVILDTRVAMKARVEEGG